MGLVSANSEKKIYLTVKKGEFVRRFKQPTKNSITRVSEKEGYEGTEFHEEFYSKITDFVITKVYTKEGNFGSQLIIEGVVDSDETAVLQFKYGFGEYQSIAKKVANIDISLECDFVPYYFKTDEGKTREGINIYQAGNKIHNTLGREDLPELKKVKRSGKMVFDWEPIYKVLDQEIEAFAERLEDSAQSQKNADLVDSFESDDYNPNQQSGNLPERIIKKTAQTPQLEDEEEEGEDVDGLPF